MKILSLSTVFPRPDEPLLGLFVQSRLERMAESAEIRVVAPVPWLSLPASGVTRPLRGGAHEGTDGRLRVMRPRWYYPPGFGGLNGSLLAASLTHTLSKLRKEFPFDLIDAHFGYPEGVAAARLAERFGCPFVVTLRGNETMHGAAGRKRELMSAALQKAAAVIGVSRRLCDFAVELGVEPKRTHVIPNGVDSRTFHPRERAAARAALGMAEGRLHIVSAGYLIERKGHHHIVKALPSLRAAGLNCDLWIIGESGKEGDFEQAIRGAVSEHGLGGCVHMAGAVAPEQLAEYMSAADIFCLASSREGWPNVVNEALACGTPVVATDVGGVPDMLPGKEYGVVVQPQSSEALLEGLKTALTRRWDREAIAIWGAARSWGKVAEETLTVLRTASEGAKG